MKHVFIVLFILVSIFSHADTVTIQSIEIQHIGRAVTRDSALIRFLDIGVDQAFESSEELEEAVQLQILALKNTRYFSSVDIVKKFSPTDENQVNLKVVIEDGWTLLPIPYPIPDTSIGRNGWSFGAEINYDNFLGTMLDFYFDGYVNFAFGEQRKLKKFRINPKLNEVKVGDLTYSLELSQEYDTTQVESSDGSEILSYYTSSSSYLEVTTNWNFLGEWRYELSPKIGLNYNYQFFDTFESLPVSSNEGVYKDSFDFTLRHSIGEGRIDWIGPLRRGYTVKAANSLKFLESQLNEVDAPSEFRFVADVEIEGKGYLPIGSLLNYCTRAKGLMVFGAVQDGLGSDLRGVKNSTMTGDTGFFWQNTLAVQLLELGDFNLQIHPFVDTGLTFERGEGPYALLDLLRFGFGADTVFLIGSIDLTVKTGYDILADYIDFTFYTRLSY